MDVLGAQNILEKRKKLLRKMFCQKRGNKPIEESKLVKPS